MYTDVLEDPTLKYKMHDPWSLRQNLVRPWRAFQRPFSIVWHPRALKRACQLCRKQCSFLLQSGGQYVSFGHFWAQNSTSSQASRLGVGVQKNPRPPRLLSLQKVLVLASNLIKNHLSPEMASDGKLWSKNSCKTERNVSQHHLRFAIQCLYIKHDITIKSVSAYACARVILFKCAPILSMCVTKPNGFQKQK